jgi:hypothetical protein
MWGCSRPLSTTEQKGVGGLKQRVPAVQPSAGLKMGRGSVKKFFKQIHKIFLIIQSLMDT